MAACASGARRFERFALATDARALHFEAGSFRLQAWAWGPGWEPVDELPEPATRERVAGSSVLVVYIEGDGRAWPSARIPPSDPTPRSTLVVELAAADPAAQVLYLARPCQFPPREPASRCDVRWWTRDRYSQTVVAALSTAIDAARRRVGAARIQLIGYSGGGVLAALLASQRDDVSLWTTIAAPLDLDAWTALHRLTPLAGAERLRAARARLRRVPQLHLVGGRDRIVPPAIVEGFAAQLAPGEGAVRIGVLRVPDADHARGWRDGWPARVAEFRRVFAASQPGDAW